MPLWTVRVELVSVRWPGGPMQTIFQQSHRIPPASANQAHRSPSSHPAQGIPVTPEQLAAHLEVSRYGDFLLTDAIRPSPSAAGAPIVPREGFRTDVYVDAAAGIRVPVLAASISREKL